MGHGNESTMPQSILISMSTVGAAAIIVCSTAIAMAAYFKLFKVFFHRLAIYQVFAAMLYSVVCVLQVVFINYDYDKEKSRSVYRPICVFEGFMLEYTMWIKLMFTFCLTFHLFFYLTCTRCRERFNNFNRIEKIYILVSIFGPLLFTWIPFVSINSHGPIYGLAGAWCWIQNWRNDNASDNLPQGEYEQYFLLYGPAIICLLLSGVAVVVIIVAIIRRAYNCCGFKDDCSNWEQIERKKMLKVILPLVIYPILSLLFYIPAFINRVIGSTSTSPNITSFMWSAISLPLVGLLAGVSLIIHIIILKCSNTQDEGAHEETPSTINERESLIHCSNQEGYYDTMT